MQRMASVDEMVGPAVFLLSDAASYRHRRRPARRWRLLLLVRTSKCERKLAAGNWKMNGTSASAIEIERLLPAISNVSCEVLLCPPATLVASMTTWAQGSDLLVGGQDCHANASGPHTGDISATMLVDAGASFVLVGHSERRSDHGKSDALIHAKAVAAQAVGLTAIAAWARRKPSGTLAAPLRWSAGRLRALCRTVPPDRIL